jgi:superfamily II DNA or RNA helicase
MLKLSELQLNYSYRKGQNDIATEFYIPCMERSLTYDRAVGFFSSSIYVLCWSSLKNFIHQGGKMRFVCSPILSGEDINALSEGYTKKEEKKFSDELKKELEDLLNNPYLSKPAKVVATLVKLEIIEFKIAFIGSQASPQHKKIFHDKLGIFGDNNDFVAFKGSMNETWSGLSLDGNLESVDVYVTWIDDREEGRVNEEKQYFEKLWNNKFPYTDIVPFPKVAHEHLVNASDVDKLPDLIEEINKDIIYTDTLSAEKGKGARRPLPHQITALRNWFNAERRGIFEHATGSGKTFTGLCAIRDALERREIPLILVPSKLLLRQWHSEIKQSFRDINPSILLCGDGQTKWRSKRLLGVWSSLSNKKKIILSMMPTAASEPFRKMIRQGEHLFILGDEVHRLGSTEHLKILEIDSGARLGLSATPRRAGDLVGTSAIINYFGDIIPPPFLMKDAIKAKVLAPYMYYTHTVQLNDNEQEQWDKFSGKIKKLYAQYKTKSSEKLKDRITRLLILRSKIAKSANEKIQTAGEVIEKNYTKGQRWIVYCDSQNQIHDVMREITRRGIQSTEYHSEMIGDREQTLKHFEMMGGIVVSIRCLDEGVDIPSVTHALILASSRNPREFIQRRGRVLRKAKRKALAYIHDVMVIPREFEDVENADVSILRGELVRGIEFGMYAMNPSSVTDLKRIALRFNLNYDELRDSGIEVEEKDE